MVVPLPALHEVLAGLFASAAWDLILQPAFGSLLPSDAPDDQVTRLRYDRAARAVIDAVRSDLAEVSPESIDTLAAFLRTPEVRGMVRSLFYCAVTEEPTGYVAVENTFVGFWEAQGNSHLPALDPSSVFEALARSCEFLLDEGIHDGVLSAHEAKDAARQATLMTHLEGLKRELAILTAPRPVDLVAVARFEADLRAHIVDEVRTVQPPSFSGAPPVALSDLYVHPDLAWESPRDGSPAPARTNYRDFVHRLDRAVVIGNPGAGKTTLGRMITYDLVSDRTALSGGFRPTPIRVKFRTLAPSHPAGVWPSIRQYLTEIAKSHYQLDVPHEAIEHLLLSGRILVIFDGLDELSDIAQRKRARDIIHSFAKRYPTTRILVTSRANGYEHAPLDPAQYRLAYLEDFTEDQVSTYVTRWFSLSSTGDAREDRSQAFLRESADVADLRRNPLMLALMCVLYRGRGYIPRNRPQVYDRCSTMLFETWDRQRGVESVLPIEEHLRPALRDIALWLWSTPELQDGATEAILVERTTQFLLKWRFRDRGRAEYAARQFFDFCRGRAWVFSVTGRSASDEALFGFTHRTFLEFFAAEQLVEEADSPEDLVDELVPHIVGGEWDMVGQLACQTLAKSLGNVDRALRRLLATATTADSTARLRVIGFAARVLDIVVPTPETVDAVVDTALDLAASASPDEEALEVFRTLLRARSDVQHLVVRLLGRKARSWLTGPPAKQELATELLLQGNGDAAVGPALYSAWNDELLDVPTQQAMAAAARGNVNVAVNLWHARWLEVEELCRMYGTSILLAPVPSIFRQAPRSGSPVADALLSPQSKHAHRINEILAAHRIYEFSKDDVREAMDKDPYFVKAINQDFPDVTAPPIAKLVTRLPQVVA